MQRWQGGRRCSVPDERLSILLLNKPFGVLSQFSPEHNHPTLAEFIDRPGFYPAGRLDRDSEGLLLLTDHGPLQHRIAHPKRKMPKTYLVQVEGEVSDAAMEQLRGGVKLKDGMTKPCEVRSIPEPDWLWSRDPPVRFRQSIPTSWLELVLREGRNRQVRRMTAAVGYPTLRLVRSCIGPWRLGQLEPGGSLLMRVSPRDLR